MKCVPLVLACLLGFSAIPSAESLSPVTRVVELLKQLSAQAEKEGKKEEDLYETYVCWGKSIIEQKTASNAKSEARINELETYIADLESGRVELTDERVTLEKEIAELMADLEEAKALRKKENGEFLDAEDEMTKAKTALKGAIDTLDEATKDHKEGVLLAVRARLKGASRNGGMAELAQHQASLKHAVELGERFLAKSDATFLKRVLLGDVPKVDWKKLNRKATFKMAYKARSFKIQDVLKKLHQTFTINLDDATAKEKTAKDEYEKLKKAKSDTLSATQKALSKMESEGGANGMSKEESQEEVDMLKEQVENDEKFIKQTEKNLADKKKEWKIRSDLRAGEIAAISKAIFILHNDDSRDLFKKSFASQESFVQLSQTTHRVMVKRANTAAMAIQDAERRTGDKRLLALVSALKAPSDSVKTKFDPVIASIDKMIKKLKEDEEKDLGIKQDCEDDRMDDTRSAIVASREIDEMTELINKLTAKIEDCENHIAELKEAHKKTKEELDDATKMREDENRAWKQTDKDDKEAAETVQKAKDVLENFYKENDLVFAQKSKAPVTAAGEAPPPPPPTWEGDYGGKTGESQGIVAIMQMVKEDIEKDRADAKSDEDASQKEYDAFKKDSEDTMKALKDEKEETEKAMGKAETKRSETKKSRNTRKGELDGTLEKIAGINPNCEYFEVNYVMRRENRQIEMDGLAKAKAILQGGVFDAPDPNREIKPGDAFLQKRLPEARFLMRA